MTDPRRGEMWLVDLGEPVGHEQAGTRPAVVVSADPFNLSSAGLAIVVPVTTRHRGIPSHIEIDARDSGLDETSYARCEDVRSISRRRLVARLGAAGLQPMFEIGRVLRFLLDV